MKAGGGLAYRVEVAEAGDLPEVRALAASVEDVQRWPGEAWGTFVDQSEGAGRAGVLLLGRDAGGRTCGWLAGTMQAGSGELEFVWVRPGERGCGLGRLLVQRWLAWAAERSGEEVFLEVRASNEGAIGLYRSLGFAEQGRRRGYYREPVEDAIAMRAALPFGG